MSEIITPRGNLEENLRDTLMWCSRPEIIDAEDKLQKKKLRKTTKVGRGRLYKVYRSDAFAEYANKVIKSYGDDRTAERETAFDNFLAERNRFIDSVPLFDVSLYNGLVEHILKAPQKLLLASLDETIVDGASEVASYGFIDVNDAPPIDTWVDLAIGTSGTKYVISWVPAAMTKYVDEAIEVNCVSMLAWAKYSNNKLKRIPPD